MNYSLLRLTLFLGNVFFCHTTSPKFKRINFVLKHATFWYGLENYHYYAHTNHDMMMMMMIIITFIIIIHHNSSMAIIAYYDGNHHGFMIMIMIITASSLQHHHLSMLRVLRVERIHLDFHE